MSGLTLTATALAGMVLGCAVVGGVGQVAVVRARVDAAADLAALAAASTLGRGETAARACAVAGLLTTGPAGGGPTQGPVRVSGCRVDGAEVTVSVDGPVHVLGLTGSVTGRARAGPVSST